MSYLSRTASALPHRSALWDPYPIAVAVMIFGAACHLTSEAKPASPTAVSRQVVNLHAFARLYGVVRWFHPSDAASAVDWDRLAIEGARRVLDAPNQQSLRATLSELFAPIAPTAHIVTNEEPFPDEPALRPNNFANLDVVAWEHQGYGDSAVTGLYASKRRHRERTVPVAGYPYGALWQAVDAKPYRGAQLRMRGKIRVSNARAQLWVRVERGEAIGFYDRMRDRPVASRTWESAEISGTVDQDATRIVFGTMVSGGGSASYDDIELAVQAPDGTWMPITIKDPGFEAGDPIRNWQPGFGTAAAATLDGWRVTLDHDRPASGASSLRVEAVTRVVKDELFADAPKPGETVDIDLGVGLRARVPIALYSRDGRTIGDDPGAARSLQAGPPMASSPGFDVVSGVADVIVAWNVLQHFWPYWDNVSVNWMAQLDASLRDALDDRSVDDHVMTLQRLSVAAPDAHARVGCPGKRPVATPAFAVEFVEGHIVVTATKEPAVRKGDIVISVDGRPATVQLAGDEALISGSPQWRRVRTLWQFGAGPSGSKLTLRVNRGGVELDVTVTRNDETAKEFSHSPIERLDDGIYYVDLSRASMPEIDAVMDRLATAPGVIFDVRDRPNSNQQVLSHLLAHPDDSKDWLAVPHVIRPDHGRSSIPSWDKSGWEMPVLQPHIAGRVAFLTGAGAVSFAESMMGLVEHYHLGEIVGGPTAGTNGDIAQVAEPTGCSSMFTGLRVTKSDGSRFYLIGVQPTIPASRTIAGIIAGRDEVLERALVDLRSASH